MNRYKHKLKSSLLILCSILFVLLAIPWPAAAQSSDELYFTILHTNDEHSSLRPVYHIDRPEVKVGGFAKLAAAIAAVRAEKEAQNEPVLLFGAGDFLGETAYGWLATRGHAVELSLMQQLGYDALTIGNHEFDFGTAVLAGYFEAAGYPAAQEKTRILAANIQPPADDPLSDLIVPSDLITLDNGLTIGLFGLIGEDAISVASDTGEITFLDQVTVARAQVAALRSQGAELIVMLSHSGEDEDVALVKQVPDIDIIIGGHSHTLLTEPIREGKTLIVQTGSQTRYLGRLDLAFDRQTTTLRLRQTEGEPAFVSPLDQTVAQDAAIAAVVDSDTDLLNEELAKMTEGRFTDITEPLFSSSFILSNQPPLAESPAGNFITDAMRQITQEITGRKVDVAVMANGNIRGSLIPDPQDGTVNFYDVVNLVGLGYGQDGFPGYSIVSVYLTGQELYRVLEVASLLPALKGDEYFLQFSGLSYTYNPRDAVLFTVPFLDLPLPSLHAVKDARLFQADGLQPAELTQVLSRDDPNLYHLVTDTYILSFLPMVGDLLPQFAILPKDETGAVVMPEDFGRLAVPFAGHDLKVWETVALYARSLSDEPLSAYYQTAADRIKPVKTIPLVVYLILGLALLIGFIVWLCRFILRKMRRKGQTRRRQSVSSR